MAVCFTQFVIMVTVQQSISQYSMAVHLRCVGIVIGLATANLLLSLPVKVF